MNDFILEILDPTKNILEVETSFGTVVNNIQIEIFDESTITISSNEPIIQLADITDLSVDARNFLLTPSSSGLRILVTDKTGSGNLVFSNSPNFSGIPTVPTAANGTNTNQIASTAFVRTEINNNTSNNLLIASVSGLQVALDGKQPSGNYASSSHTHVASDITNFNSIVSGLLPVKNVVGSGYVNVVSTTGNYTVYVTGLQPSGNYAQSAHSHIISDITDLQSVLDSKQASGNYASLSHTHTATNITDFNASVSGLVNGIYAPLNGPTLTGIPLAPTAISGTNTNQIASTAFVRTEISNLISSSPSTLDTLNELASALGNDANFSTTVTNNLAGKANLSGAIFTGSISVPSGDFTNLRQNGVIVSVSGHTHTINDVSGLQTALDNKQPSGSYAPLNHSHTASNITDFNSAVSGLLSVKNITSGSGINVSNISGIYTIAVTSNFGLTSEEVDDRVSNLLNAGTGILLSYNDNSNSLIISTSGLQPSGNYSIVGHSHIISDVSGLQTSLDSKQPSGNYAPLSHSHIASNITDFNSSVSGLLPVKNISGSGYVSVSSSSGNYTINVSGLQPSGNYSLVGHSHSISDVSGLQLALDGKQPSGNYAPLSHIHTINDVSGLQTALDSKQPSGNYAPSSHTHTSSNITDFNSSVSGLLPVKNITGSAYTNIVATTGNFTISITGLQPSGSYAASVHTHSINEITGLQTSLDSKQPSGNYAASSHTHAASQITDFNSSVSGILPVKNIVAGSNITVSSSSGIYTINSTASGGGGSASARGNITTTGILSSFNIAEGYSVGYLDLFQNGVKLLSGGDFIATNGNSVSLVNSVPSGTVLEYITLLPSISSNNYVKLDNISSSFNDSSTSFGLAVSGTAYYPVSANTLGIYVGGVAQEPIFAYSVSGSNIVFTEAPASGLTFWGVGYGTTAVATLNGIAPGSSGSPSISSSNDLTAGFYFPSSGNISVAGNLGIGTNSPSTNLDINSNKFRVRNSKTPSSSTDTGNTGDICWDNNYVYICTSSNNWKRSRLLTYDVNSDNTLLLAHFDTNYVDSSLSAYIATVRGSATLSTSITKIGSGSAYFPETAGGSSTSAILYGFGSAWDLMKSDFTIEAWTYALSIPNYAGIICRDNQSDRRNWQMLVNFDGVKPLVFSIFNTSAGSFIGLSDTVAFPTNQWVHIAAVRDNGIYRLYKNGIQVSSASASGGTGTIATASGPVSIGSLNENGNYGFNGYIDEVRILNKCVYPNGTTFTPSITPYLSN